MKTCFNMEMNLPKTNFMLCPTKCVWWMFRNLRWMLHFAAEFDACVNKYSCFWFVLVLNCQTCNIVLEHVPSLLRSSETVNFWHK
jgi:hypothetical protein